MPATKLECRMTTPLGLPVDPLVYMITATSDGYGIVELDVFFFVFNGTLSNFIHKIVRTLGGVTEYEFFSPMATTSSKV